MSTSETLVRVIKIIVGIVEVLLGLNAILKLLGALPTLPLFQFIYDISNPLISPFSGIFQPILLGERFVLDLAVLFSMIAYLILGTIFIKLIEFVFSKK